MSRSEEITKENIWHAKNYYSTQETLHWRPWFFRCNEHPLLKGKDRSPQTSEICKLLFFL
jgi:hypothetical protein